MGKTIGFIGTGVMGSSMASHLLEAGHTVLVYNRTKEKAQALVDKGAVWKETVTALSEEADIVMTIVGYPQDVEAIYLGEGGILQAAKPGAFVVDMTTSSPKLAEKIYHAAKEKGIAALDAPVSGGDVGAKNAALTIMVGGDQEAFDKLESVFSLMGKNVILQGGAGAGQYTKMCNQIAIAAGMIGVTESMVYAKHAGLDPSKVLESIAFGAAGSWSLSNLAPRMISGNFEPGFYIKHFIKDVKIALDSAKEMELEMPGLSLALSLYETLANEGKEDKGTQALFTLLDK